MDHVKCRSAPGHWCLNKGTLLCKTDSDGWLVWVRRVNNTVRFDCTWDEYVAGFGNPDGNYWLGLNNLNLLTSTANRFKMRVELESLSGQRSWVEYSEFSVGGSTSGYKLSISGFESDKQSDLDVLALFTNNQAFSTKDKDHDAYGAGSCSSKYGGGGGWWYQRCGNVFPTAEYSLGRSHDMSKVLRWSRAFNDTSQLKSLVMKVKPL